jgi:C4-dicarboxylate transporter DctM subunit
MTTPAPRAHVRPSATPVNGALGPAGAGIGVNPIQLGVMMVVNLSIGLFTPPIGTTLFISAAISREKIGAIVRELWPFMSWP